MRAAALLFAGASLWAAPATVTISGYVYTAAGASGTAIPATGGSIIATLAAPCVIGAEYITRGPVVATIGSDGSFSLPLVPTASCETSGNSYSVRYKPQRGSGVPLTEYTETWTVPASPSSTTIAAVRSATVPSPLAAVSWTQLTGIPTPIGALASAASANYVFAGPSTGSAAVGSYRALVAADIPSISTDKLTSGTLANARTTATSTNTPSTIALRDASGNLSAGTITASLSGNASTADALSSNPADCSAGQYATAIAANGNLTCAGLSGTISSPTVTGALSLAGVTSGNVPYVQADAGNTLDLKGGSGGVRILNNAGTAAVATISDTGVLSATVPTATLSTGQVALARGGTGADLSATGGTSRVLRQSSAGAAVTVSQLSATDISGLAASATTDTTSASNIGTGTLNASRLPSILNPITIGNTTINSDGSISVQTDKTSTAAGAIWLQPSATTINAVSLVKFGSAGYNLFGVMGGGGVWIKGFPYVIIGDASDATSGRILVSQGYTGIAQMNITGHSGDTQDLLRMSKSSGQGRLRITADATLVQSSGSAFRWADNSDAVSGTADTGLERGAAGRVKVTNGSTGYGAIDASAYHASGTAGQTRSITVKGSDGNNCTITFTGGLSMSTTCP